MGGMEMGNYLSGEQRVCPLVSYVFDSAGGMRGERY
jgi:hypothetical protein